MCEHVDELSLRDAHIETLEKRIAELEAERDATTSRLTWHEQQWSKLTADLRAVGVTLLPNSQGDDDFAGQIVRAVEDRNETIAEMRDTNRQREDYWRARVAELEAERRWVPIGDRLPGIDEQVLVRCANGYHAATSMFDVYKEDGKLVVLWCDAHIPDGGVTHWMPLPKPPEATDAD